MRPIKIAFIAVIMTIFSANMANAQKLGDLFGNGIGQTVGNLLEGVFSSSNITIADMEGEWTSDGPAVCFQGEGFLKKAGGAAAAAALESKLSTYYDRFGLTGAVLTIDSVGNFTLQCKSIKLKGSITQKAEATPGVFEFDFTILGKKIAGVTTYIQKTSTTMDVMFDVTKLKKLLSAVASTLNISTLNTISSLLDQYEGLCAGFHMTGTNLPQKKSDFGLGNILGWGSNKNKGSARDSTTTDKSKTDTETAIKNGLDLLKDKLKKK